MVDSCSISRIFALTWHCVLYSDVAFLELIPTTIFANAFVAFIAHEAASCQDALTELTLNLVETTSEQVTQPCLVGNHIDGQLLVVLVKIAPMVDEVLVSALSCLIFGRLPFL